MKIIVTGGAGFIGSSLVRYLINETSHTVVVLDKLTYAGNLNSLAPVAEHSRFHFHQLDIGDRQGVAGLLSKYEPDALIHLAAESHVDRSISAPGVFLETNVMGTYALLESVREYWSGMPSDRAELFRMIHVSTDEVFGELSSKADPFDEESKYSPNNPYSASKAASDHLARAWHRTFGLPIIITNCSNNYGPYQFPEKFIPHMILCALEGQNLPIYGDGRQVRDWLFVDDHSRALLTVLKRGQLGETYNIGGRNERCNLDMVKAICKILDDLVPGRRSEAISNFSELIGFVDDRPGHDTRYAINADKMLNEFGYLPAETLESGLHKTVLWYLENEAWWRDVLNGSYRLARIGAGK